MNKSFPVLCFATQNKDKIKEVQEIAGNRFRIIGLEELEPKGDLPEKGKTLEENALQKALYVHTKYQIDCFLMIQVGGSNT